MTFCSASIHGPGQYSIDEAFADITGMRRHLFVDMYRQQELYRATGIVLMKLSSDTNLQFGLFEDALRAERVQDICMVMDEISAKYGKHSLHLGASHFIEALGKGKRREPTARKKTCLFQMK